MAFSCNGALGFWQDSVVEFAYVYFVFGSRPIGSELNDLNPELLN
jgi:hypothetical protein